MTIAARVQFKHLLSMPEKILQGCKEKKSFFFIFGLNCQRASREKTAGLRCIKLDKFKVQKCLSRRIREILRPRTWQKCRNEEFLYWKFSPSSWNGFINIGTKTGDVGKFFFFRWHLAKATTSLYFLNCIKTAMIVSPLKFLYCHSSYDLRWNDPITKYACMESQSANVLMLFHKWELRFEDFSYNVGFHRAVVGSYWVCTVWRPSGLLEKESRTERHIL